MKRLIVLLLVLINLTITNGKALNSNIDSLVKEQVESKFVKPDKKPIRYDSNILILLQGYPTREDSMIFKELADTLNILIDKWNVTLVPNGTANLEVGINIPFDGEWKPYFNQNYNQNEIIKSTIYLHLPKSLDYTSRKKIIYYNILRSMVIFKADKKEFSAIPGSVFSEQDPRKITFHPVDFKIVQELYSQKYEDKPRPSPKTTASGSGRGKQNYTMIFNLMTQLLSYAFIIFMALKGAFKDHHYRFEPFIKQGALVLIAIAFQMGLYAFQIALNVDFKVSPAMVFAIASLGTFLGGLIIVCLVFLLERAILKDTNNFTLEIIVPLLSIAFITTVLILITMFVIENIQPVQNIQSSIRISVFINLIASVGVHSLLIGLGRSIFIFSRKTSENIIRKKDLELARMSALHKQAELQSLRAKINPHFLYNALNSIASLATTDGRKTEQMALSLSDFFKYAINREQKQLNTISEELNAIRTYLEIEKVRFGERLDFEIDCPAELLDIHIPQLLIQPLVENALKHGLSQITGKGFIKVSIGKDGNQLKIRVYDNGPAFPEGPLSGFGIQNTQERIALVYGAKAGINWQNRPDKYIEIKLPL